MAFGIMTGNLSSRMQVLAFSGFHEPDRAIQKEEFLRKIIRSIEEGRYQDAERQVNRLLARDPTNAGLHVINGLVFYSKFLAGDRFMADQAEVGFMLARQFDPSLPLAGYLLGSLYLDMRQFQKARVCLLDAAANSHGSPQETLALLARAAYFARDIPLAVWAIDAGRQERPDDRELRKAGAVIYAAAGDDVRARDILLKIGPSGSDGDLRQMGRRVEDWKNIFRTAIQSAGSEAEDPKPLPAGRAVAAPENAAPVQTAEAQAPGGVLAHAWSDCAQSIQAGMGGTASGFGNSGTAGGDELPLLPALPSPCKGLPLPRMAILDVVIARTLENSGFSHGMNLLQGISLVLGFNRSETRISGTSGETYTRTITQAVGLPSAGLSYSLNIFRTSGSRVEVLARPSLLVLDRIGSTFFSGSTVSVALTGQYGGSLQDKHVGVGMSVTPTFIDDQTMLLALKVMRSFVEPIQMQGFDQSMTTSTNSVTANTRIRFGDTMVLSGLKEKETYSMESGVPVLGRLPFFKHFFGTHIVDEYTKHLLVFITPHKPEWVDEKSGQAELLQEELKRIGERGNLPADVSEKIRQITRQYEKNLRAVLSNLGPDRYRQEFKTGDLGLGGDRTQPKSLFQKIQKDLRQLM